MAPMKNHFNAGFLGREFLIPQSVSANLRVPKTKWGVMNKKKVQELEDLALGSWIEMGEALGMTAELANKHARGELEQANKDASEEQGGLLFDSPIGTKWVKNKDGSDADESKYLNIIQACSQNYEKEHVGIEDVMWFWDLSNLERAIEFRTINIPRYAAYYYFLKNGHTFQPSGSYDSVEDAIRQAGKLVQKYAPSFELCHPSFYTGGPHSALPSELIFKVNDWYIKGVSSNGFDGLPGLIGNSGSINEEARRQLKLGAL